MTVRRGGCTVHCRVRGCTAGHQGEAGGRQCGCTAAARPHGPCNTLGKLPLSGTGYGGLISRGATLHSSRTSYSSRSPTRHAAVNQLLVRPANDGRPSPLSGTLRRRLCCTAPVLVKRLGPRPPAAVGTLPIVTTVELLHTSTTRTPNPPPLGSPRDPVVERPHSLPSTRTILYISDTSRLCST